MRTITQCTSLEIFQNFAYASVHTDPEEITVVLGINNTVTWTNQNDVVYGIVSDNSGVDLWRSPGVLKPEDSFSVTFDITGIREYHGMPPPWMTCKVVVF